MKKAVKELHKLQLSSRRRRNHEASLVYVLNEKMRRQCVKNEAYYICKPYSQMMDCKAVKEGSNGGMQTIASSISHSDGVKVR